jgi:hypothetical protein
MASRANHPITIATPGVCCMNTSEHGILEPGVLLALWGRGERVHFHDVSMVLAPRTRCEYHLYGNAHDLPFSFTILFER